ncbi:heme uptake protein IsdC [Paenibacillus endophyticus]|uniref:Heme uptake protein IsdC n=1 Tax=Paenibacillus endophyticus TaxID=1294268 RepID=A0A7W5C958_9BACL|nr:heme uptake protein IsdC [Paenibacillus endophyticus]MBB3152449.1 heme uptake protein IsdC [Paenibacillus endophyticus]
MRKLSLLISFYVCFVVLFAIPVVSAAEYEDGTYSIDYVIKKAEDESASMANDYWEKPAKVIVDNGKLTIQIQINHSKWVTEFKTPTSSGGYSEAKVVSSNKADDTRLTQFSVADLSATMLSKIHVTVPDIDYDHDYTIRFDFDASSMKLISKPAVVKEETPAATKKPTDAPKATTVPKATAMPTPKPTSKPASTEPAATAVAAEQPVRDSASPTAVAGKATEEPVAAVSEEPEAATATASPEPSPQSTELAAEAVAVSESPVAEGELASEDTGGAEVETASVDGDTQLASAEVAGETESGKSSSKGWITSSVISVMIILAGVTLILIRNRRLKK